MDYKITSFEPGALTSAISYTYTIERATKKDKEKPVQQFVVEYASPIPRVALTIAAVGVAMALCFNYLSLRSDVVSLNKQVTYMESELEEITTSNQEEYERIMNSIDMEEIRDRAMENGRMIYPFQAETVEVNFNEDDYVRQFKDFVD